MDIADSLGLSLLPPRKKITIMLIGIYLFLFGDLFEFALKEIILLVNLPLSIGTLKSMSREQVLLLKLKDFPL